MKRRVYYLALLKVSNWKYPKYEWFTDLIDMDFEEEKRMEIQIEHMKNRIQGAYRLLVPFTITWKSGEIEFPNYEI